MSEILASSGLEAAITSRMHAMARAMPGCACVLLAAERDPVSGMAEAWRGVMSAGDAVPDDLVVATTDSDHPVMRALAAAEMQWGTLNTPLGQRQHWCAIALRPVAAEPVAAVLLVLFSAAPTPHARDQVAHLAEVIDGMMTGATLAMRERRESEQLALLLRYAANPIIVSDAAAIITMNEPATRLFDVTPPTLDVEEQIPVLARNLEQLRTFLADAQIEEVHAGELALTDPRTHEDLVMAIVATRVPHALAGSAGTVAVLHDMTRSRELEDHRVRQQLFESEKLAATGRLAASIAHEINNPLEAIKNALYLLVKQSDPDDPNYRFLELAQRETERVSRIIRQMLGVSRPSVRMAKVNVNEVFREALQLLEPQLRQSHVELQVVLDDTLPLVRASADQLKQVFLNLLLNGKEAMPEGGGLLVQSRLATEADSEILAGRHVIIRIRDDGGGIPPEILPHVFEPFFSTKTERHGTGLGLWVCQEIIKQHHGQILVRSMVGRGTTFLVALPLIATEPSGGTA